MIAAKKMTRKDFDQQIKDLIKLIQEKTIAFSDDTAELKLERIKRAKTDLMYFAQTYFPHYTTAEFADFHTEELKYVETALDTDMSSITSEIWFRGSGKTVLFGVVIPIWAGMAKKSKFSIFCGADSTLSKERTVSIKLELIYNARLKHDFPDMVMEPMMGEETDFETPNGIRMIALGYKQVIRGRMHGVHRPRLIIIDDLENHNDTNPKIADKKYQFVTEEAFGAFGPKGGLIIWLGNLTNSQSALQKFVNKCDEDPSEFTRYRIVKAEDEAGNSNWPEAYSSKVLAAKRKVMGKAGYDRHFMMKPGIDGDVFKDEWLHFYNPFNPLPIENMPGFSFRYPGREDLMNAPMITFTDPSLGSKETNDYKATVTVAFWNGFYWIIDVKIQKCTMVEMLEYMYEVDKRYKTRQWMEDIFWQKLIREYLPQVAAKKGYVLPIAGHSPRLNKEERILALQPLFQFGNIYYCVNGKDWSLMKEQLIGFPNAGHDDGPDALAAAIEMFKHVATANQYQTVQKGADSFMGMF